jgi:DNA polymerase I
MFFSIYSFRQVWLVDYEFSVPPGEQVAPVCMVAKEFGSGITLKLWQDELQSLTAAPYATDRDALFVAYYASAEMNCHLALNWPMPVNVLDLYAEFRNLTNGLLTPCGNGLLGALTYFGLNGIKTAEKNSMRELALRGGPWTDEERKELLQYCESDVIALDGLLQRMSQLIDLPRALLRGRYMKAASQIEHTGIPIDMEALGELRTNWTDIQKHLIQKIDAQYGVFDCRTFKADRFAEWLTRNNIPWPRLESGKLDLQDDTFK